MWDWETPFLIMIVILMSPFAVVLLVVVLAIFCLIIDSVAFTISSFIHDIRSQHDSKEDNNGYNN